MKQKELENLHRLVIDMLWHVETSASLSQTVLSLAFSMKKKFNEMASKILTSSDEADIGVFEKHWLKSISSTPQNSFLAIFDPSLFREEVAAKMTILSKNFKELKTFDKKRENRLTCDLILIAKFLTFFDDFPCSFEVLHEIYNLTLRLLKKTVKNLKLGFKSIGLLSLILSITNFLAAKPHDLKNLEKMDVLSLMKLVLETSLEGMEKRHSSLKMKGLFEFLEDYIRNLKNGKTKFELIDLLLAFYFKFLTVQHKLLTSKEIGPERRESFNKASSINFMQVGESFRNILAEDNKKLMRKSLDHYKEMLLWLIINAFELNTSTYKENREDSSLHNDDSAAVNFFIVFSKSYLSKVLSSETMSLETPKTNNPLLDPTKPPNNLKAEQMGVITEEKNVFAFLKDILKRNGSLEFRMFLFETINSKLKLKIKGNSNSRQQQHISKLLYSFNVKAARLINDFDIFKKVFFELFNKYEEANDEEMKNFLLNLTKKTVQKLDNSKKLNYLLSQEFSNFCKVCVFLKKLLKNFRRFLI